MRGPFAKGLPAPLLKVFIAFLWAQTMRKAVWCVADSGGTKARAFAKQKRRARIALRAGEDNRPTGLCVAALCIADCGSFGSRSEVGNGPYGFVQSRFVHRKDYSPTAGAVPPPSQGRDYCNPFFSQQTERFRKFQTKAKFYRLLKKAKTLFVPPQVREGGTRRVTGEDAPSQRILCIPAVCASRIAGHS